jgi:hypothetical protein
MTNRQRIARGSLNSARLRRIRIFSVRSETRIERRPLPPSLHRSWRCMPISLVDAEHRVASPASSLVQALQRIRRPSIVASLIFADEVYTNLDKHRINRLCARASAASCLADAAMPSRDRQNKNDETPAAHRRNARRDDRLFPSKTRTGGRTLSGRSRRRRHRNLPDSRAPNPTP